MIRDGSAKVDLEADLYCLLYNIKYLRGKYELTQREMAELMGISVGSIAAIEKGIAPRCLRAKEIICLALDFHLSVDDLMKKRLDEV